MEPVSGTGRGPFASAVWGSRCARSTGGAASAAASAAGAEDRAALADRGRVRLHDLAGLYEVIGKVVRGTDARSLLYYLYGPGKANEHTDPHLVAGFSDPQELEPERRPDGSRDFRRLTGLLAQPLAALAGPGCGKPVWHCAVRAAPEDRPLSDAEWAQVAAGVMGRTGLAGEGLTRTDRRARRVGHRRSGRADQPVMAPPRAKVVFLDVGRPRPPGACWPWAWLACGLAAVCGRR